MGARKPMCRRKNLMLINNQPDNVTTVNENRG